MKIINVTFLFKFFLVLYFPFLLHAESTHDCRVPGITRHWQLDHCLIGQPSDDEEYPTVKACMDLLATPIASQDCKQNERIKKYRCLYLLASELVGQSVFRGTLDECLDSAETVGSTVKNGGIGG